MSTDLDLSDFYETHLLEVLTRSFLPCRPPIDIPPYQRPYRWSISEVRKLLDDLDSFRYNPETNEYYEGARYYLELGRGRGISNLDKKARITRPAPLI